MSHPATPSTRLSRRAALSHIGAAGAFAVFPQRSLAAGPARIAIGEIRVTPLSDGHLDLPLAAFSPPPEADGGDTIHVGANVWLIETGLRRMLVDTGSGASLLGQFPHTGRLPAALARIGIPAPSITDIIVTHMHPDHIGGLMHGGLARYPNAMVHVCDIEWAWWTAPERASTLPVAQRPLAHQVAVLADSFAYRIAVHEGGSDIGAGVWTEHSPGHTPGHQIVHVSDGGDSLLILGDAFICADVQIPNPQVHYALDADPEAAAQTRLALFDRIATDALPFAATHLPEGCAHMLDRNPAGTYALVKA